MSSLTPTPTGCSRWTPRLASVGLMLLCFIPALISAQEGEYLPVATISDIMTYMVMPAANVLWSGLEIDFDENDQLIASGPEDDAGWELLRGQALNMEEATNLLLMPDRPAAAGDEAPEGELSSPEIAALIKANWHDWTLQVAKLRSVAGENRLAIEQHDANALLDASDALNTVCEGCHQQFWYPAAAQ